MTSKTKIVLKKETYNKLIKRKVSDSESIEMLLTRLLDKYEGLI